MFQCVRRAARRPKLTIPNGMYGFLGPNAAGKSTLMRMLATLQDPDEGRINLIEHPVMAGSQSSPSYLTQSLSGAAVTPDSLRAQLLDVRNLPDILNGYRVHFFCKTKREPLEPPSEMLILVFHSIVEHE